MEISNFTRKEYCVVTPYEGIATLKDRLLKHLALVVKEGEEILGVLVPEDIIKHPHNLVIDCMSPKPALTSEMRVQEALLNMNTSKNDVLPVYANDSFTGLIFKDDLIQFINSQKTSLEDKVKIHTAQLAEASYTIEKSEKILKSIFDSTQNTMFLVSPEYQILFFNKKAKENTLLQNASEIKIGGSVLDHIPKTRDNLFETFTEEFKKAVEGEFVVSEKEITSHEGAKWCRCEYIPVYENNNPTNLIGIAVTIINIDQQKQYELLVLKQNEMLKEMVQIQSHQVRQPVANILGLVPLLIEESLTTEGIEILKKLQITTQHLDDIIDKVVSNASQFYARKKSNISSQPVASEQKSASQKSSLPKN